MNHNGLTVVEKETQKVREAKAAIGQCLQILKRRYSCFLYALNIFEPVAVKEKIEPATDGKHLFFHAEQVRSQCKSYGNKWLFRTILHMMFHGMFGDFEVTEEERFAPLRSAVMDLKVEQMVSLLGYMNENYWYGDKALYSPGMYLEGRRNKKRAKEIIEDSVWGNVDDHRFWLRIKEKQEEKNQEFGEEETESEEIADLWKQARKQVTVKNTKSFEEEISVESMLYFMEGKGYGMNPGAKRWLERIAEGNARDYSHILKLLISQKEVVKEEDTIDPALYLYGLECYGDVALVEPLELSEKRKLNTLVIAVDTSGSCIDAVPVFLRETAGILKEVERLAKGGEVCYLECDTEIVAEDLFQNYAKAAEKFLTREVSGGGGTDFRPVFKRIEKLIQEGKTVDGLFYLSDGEGMFPKQSPDYPVYFVMNRAMWNGYEPSVPDWVSVVWLKEGEI